MAKVRHELTALIDHLDPHYIVAETDDHEEAAIVRAAERVPQGVGRQLTLDQDGIIHRPAIGQQGRNEVTSMGHLFWQALKSTAPLGEHGDSSVRLGG
ncbi:hypothetical protein ADL02_32770 [Streptomyces sp. NRRL WC-3723]|nr:hypothetical protein ADL02_32770 [Streptomyces sp. NRRL WC-3723]